MIRTRGMAGKEQMTAGFITVVELRHLFVDVRVVVIFQISFFATLTLTVTNNVGSCAGFELLHVCHNIPSSGSEMIIAWTA